MPFVPLIVVLHGFGYNKHDRRYDESEMLLQKIYSKSQHGLSGHSLKPSPHGEH